MSRYLLNKFLYTVDRDPSLVERYRCAPAELVSWWESTMANKLLNSHADEDSTWLAFDASEREALVSHDHVKLFELGAHPFLTLTLFIALFERDNTEPLEYQKAFGLRLQHFTLPYPDIAT
ncbi:MAG TPA: hypothetical protein VGD29_09515 [Actinoplanes sp.]|jgi:hypothetical protein